MTRKLVGLLVVTMHLGISAFTASIPPQLANKNVFKGEYPLTASFRGTQQVSATLAEWEDQVIKARTHIPDLIDPNFFDDSLNMNWANQMARKYPDRLFTQVMQAGSGVPRTCQPWPATVDRISRLPVSFPGHWVVKPPTVLTQSITPTDVLLNVQSAVGFTIVNTYMPDYPNGCPALMVETDATGKRLWNHCEYVYITSISGNQLTVTRAYRDSPPASAFPGGRTYVAPLIVERTWNEPPVWYINMSASCPLDANGKTAAQVMLDDLSTRFGPGGRLSNFSGVDFASGPFTTPPADADYDWDGVVDSAQVYYDGVKSYLSSINQSFGGNFVLLSGASNITFFGPYNGLNNEGLASPNDPWKEISNALNETTFWAKFSTLPYVTEEVMRIDSLDNTLRWLSLVRLGAGYATCLGSCVNVKDKIFTIAGTDQNVLSLAWIELYKGTENVEHWLGKPLSPPIHVAAMSPSLLGSSSSDWTGILSKVSAQNGSLAVVENELVFTPVPNKPNHTITMSLTLTQHQNLTVLFDVISGGTKMVNAIGRPVLSVSYQTGADGATEYSNIDYITREYYWRGLDASATSCTVIFSFDGNDVVRFRSMSAHEVPDAMARAFEHGVVLVNPGLEDMTFNLDTLFGAGATYRRLTAPHVTVPPEWQSQYQQTLELNSGAALSDPTRVVVPGLNALFLIADNLQSRVVAPPSRLGVLRLGQNWPNPARGVTRISYSLPNESFVNLAIYDMHGKLVRTLVNKKVSAGAHDAVWDGNDLHNQTASSGHFIYRLVASRSVSARQLVVLNRSR